MPVPRKVWIPVAAVAAIALIGLWSVALLGGPGYRTARRIDASLGKAIEVGPQRFELSRQLWPAVKAAWVPQITIRPPARWTKGVVQASEHASGLGEWQFGGPSGIGTQSRLLVCGERALLFVAQMVREDPAQDQNGRTTAWRRRFFNLAVLAGWTDRPEADRETVLVDEVEGPFLAEHLLIDVASAHGREVLVVWATIDALLEQAGSVTATGLTWSKPAPIRAVSPAQRVHDLELRRSQGWYHLVWTESVDGSHAGNTLYHARSAGPGCGWSDPRPLSRTAGQGPFGAVADRGDVFVAWSDSRLKDTRAAGFVNDRKLFVARSRNEGRSFGRPILISDPVDPGDAALRLLLEVADRDLVVYWSPEYNAPWQHAVIDRDLETATLLGENSGEVVGAAYKARLRLILEGSFGGLEVGDAGPAGDVHPPSQDEEWIEAD